MKKYFKNANHKLAKVGTFVLWLFKKRVYIYVALLAALSIYKPIALFQTLSLAQTFLNIFCNIFVSVATGAAVYLHNLLTV